MAMIWLSRMGRGLRTVLGISGSTHQQRPFRKAESRFQKLLLEPLEDRFVPTALPPGTYGGTFTSNMEFLDPNGTYVINNLTVNPGVTLTVGANVNVLIKADQNVTVNG